MANAVLTQLLQPQVVLRVISRIRDKQGFMGRFFGFQPDRYDPESVTLTGPNTLPSNSSVRNAVYRIYDSTRVVAKFRSPGTGPATVALNPMGQVQIAVARFHQKIDLEAEFLGNLSKMVGPNSEIDAAGQDYITRQEGSMARQFSNSVEMMAAGMARDSLYFSVIGDDWFPSFTAPANPGTVGQQINFQIPSGNKNQLNMLGTGNIIGVSWANPGAPIMNDIASITAAYVQLSGYAMTDVIVNGLMWNNILLNTQIRNVGGSANTVYAEWTREPQTFMDGQPGVYYVGKLRALPNVNFHICDDVLALNSDIDPSNATAPGAATLAKVIPDNMAIFTTQPNSEWCQMYHGGEYVTEQPGMPLVFRGGYYAWKEYTTQPSAVSLLSLLNAIPLLYVPKAIAPSTCVF